MKLPYSFYSLFGKYSLEMSSDVGSWCCISHM